MMSLKSLRPAVSKNWLIALAGLTWSVVGLMLCRLAYHWLAATPWRRVAPLELLGIVLGLAAYHICFSRIARENITRLSLLPGKTCIFAFLRWKGYFLIGLMIALGNILRNLPIPRHYLAILYTTIGGALFLASLQYYGCLWRIILQKGSRPSSGRATG
jgi:hypothetical protein